jgi:hypothetical protein
MDNSMNAFADLSADQRQMGTYTYVKTEGVDVPFRMPLAGLRGENVYYSKMGLNVEEFIQDPESAETPVFHLEDRLGIDQTPVIFRMYVCGHVTDKFRIVVVQCTLENVTKAVINELTAGCQEGEMPHYSLICLPEILLEKYQGYCSRMSMPNFEDQLPHIRKKFKQLSLNLPKNPSILTPILDSTPHPDLHLSLILSSSLKSASGIEIKPTGKIYNFKSARLENFSQVTKPQHRHFFPPPPISGDITTGELKSSYLGQQGIGTMGTRKAVWSTHRNLCLAPGSKDTDPIQSLILKSYPHGNLYSGMPLASQGDLISMRRGASEVPIDPKSENTAEEAAKVLTFNSYMREFSNIQKEWSDRNHESHDAWSRARSRLEIILGGDHIQEILVQLNTPEGRLFMDNFPGLQLPAGKGNKTVIYSLGATGNGSCYMHKDGFSEEKSYLGAATTEFSRGVLFNGGFEFKECHRDQFPVFAVKPDGLTRFPEMLTAAATGFKDEPRRHIVYPISRTLSQIVTKDPIEFKPEEVPAWSLNLLNDLMGGKYGYKSDKRDVRPAFFDLYKTKYIWDVADIVDRHKLNKTTTLETIVRLMFGLKFTSDAFGLGIGKTDLTSKELTIVLRLSLSCGPESLREFGSLLGWSGESLLKVFNRVMRRIVSSAKTGKGVTYAEGHNSDEEAY